MLVIGKRMVIVKHAPLKELMIDISTPHAEMTGKLNDIMPWTVTDFLSNRMNGGVAIVYRFYLYIISFISYPHISENREPRFYL
jgi:hypothetical protein